MTIIPKVLVNGRFRVHRMTGMQRYAEEITQRLAPYVEVCEPQRGRGAVGHLWEQTVLPVRGFGRVVWSPCTSGPVLVRNHIVTVHDTFPIDHPEWYSAGFSRWYSALMRTFAHTASHLIAVSNFTRDRLIALTRVDDRKVTTIYNGVSQRFRRQSTEAIAKAKYNTNLPTSKYLLSVSSLESRKNLKCVLAAWASVVSELPEDMWLVLAGPKANTKVFGEQNFGPIPPRMHFTGYVPEDDLPALYAGATAFLYPSLGEGFGLPIVEAFACGTPCITASTASMPEIAGDAALLVDPRQPKELAQAIQQLLSSSALQIRLREQGYERARLFTWDCAAQQTLNIFTELQQSLVGVRAAESI